MNEHFSSKLNSLQKLLPEGLLAPTFWLEARGYSRSLLAGYVKRGWLESPARGVYRRPGPPLKWQHVVCSLAKMSGGLVHVGGLTALELRGYAHFLKPRGLAQVELYLGAKPPGWLAKLGLTERFVAHRNTLFAFPVTAMQEPPPPAYVLQQEVNGVTADPWGPWDDPLPVALPERAMLEFLDEVPASHSFEHADALVTGLGDLSSRRMLDLLAVCKSVKVKRLFLALASRHSYTWAKRVIEAADRGEVDVGKGKRALVPGGKLHPKYLITLPEMSDVRG